MGVQQAIELQNQSADFKYFHLKEDNTDELDLKESVPRLSLWGWFTPKQYESLSNTNGNNNDSSNGGGGINSSSSNLGKKNNKLNDFLKKNNHIDLVANGASISSSSSSTISSTKNLLNSDSNSSSISTSDSSDNEGDVIQMMDYKVIDINSVSSKLVNKQQQEETNSTISSEESLEQDLKIRVGKDGIDSEVKIATKNGSYPPHYFCSPIYSDIAFSLLVAVVCIFSIVYCLLVGPVPIIGAFLVSILIFVSYIFASFSPNNRWYLYSITALSVGLGLTIPTFFAATGAVVLGLERTTWDSQLVSADSSLLGWLFPLGQMGLYIDKSKSIGPDSFVGELSTEIFQLSYISYYIWGYFMEIYILFNLWKCSLSKDPQKQRDIQMWDQRLKMFICSWISTYFLVFSINLSFPAVSPRVYLHSEYSNQLNGFGFAGFIRSKIENAAKGSFGSFPSGHIATSWAVSFASYRIVPAYGFISSIASFLITIATMYLRYHYFVDFLAAVPVAVLCLLFGGFYSLSDFQSLPKRFINFLKSTFSRFSKNADKY